MARSTVLFSLIFLFIFVFESTVCRPLNSVETELIEEIEAEYSKLRILRQILDEVSWTFCFCHARMFFISFLKYYFIDCFLGWEPKASTRKVEIEKESEKDEQEQLKPVLF